MAAVNRLSSNERLWRWAVLACVLIFVGAVRFRLRDMPLERDEGEYAYGGQLLLQGFLPTQHLYTMKLPGTHAVYALIIAVFGQTCAGVHLGFLVLNGLTIVLVDSMGRRLAGTLAGLVGATTYGVLSLSGAVLGTAAHATHFVVLFALAGFHLLWSASTSGRSLAYFASGVLLGSSALVKHHGLFFGALGLAWIGWLAYSKSLGPNTTVWKAGPAFLAGMAAPLALLGILLWLTNTFETCWLWSVSYARAYGQPNPGLTLTWRMLMQRMPEILKAPFYAAPVGLAILWWRSCQKPAALFAAGLWAVSVLAVVPGLHFRPHYYVLLLPVLALFTGALVQFVTELLRNSFLKILAPAPLLGFMLLVGNAVFRERSLFFQLTPDEACRALYSSDLFIQAPVVANYMRDHCPPNARIAVLGSEPEVYFYSRRLSATGYIYTYPLMERQPFAEQMRSQMKEEILAAQPHFILQVRTWTSWKPRPIPQQRLNQFCDLLMPAGYELVASCDFDPKGSGARWHFSPDTSDPPGESTELLVFERKSEPQGSGHANPRSTNDFRPTGPEK